jgi:hypothetical protein
MPKAKRTITMAQLVERPVMDRTMLARNVRRLIVEAI